MDKKLIQEIKRIKELSNINESVINEGILDDIKNFISKASEEISKTKAFQKLKDFYGKVKLGGSTFSEKPFSVTTSDDDFYKGILNGIGAPITPENMKYLYAWRKDLGAVRLHHQVRKLKITQHLKMELMPQLQHLKTDIMIA